MLSDARYTSTPGWYDVTVTMGGRSFVYTVSPDDDAPMAVAIRAEMIRNPIEIAAYVEPAYVTERRAAEAFDNAIRDFAKAESFVQQFVNMTPQQVISHVDTNVTNIESAKTLLKRMAVMMLLIARREFR